MWWNSGESGEMHFARDNDAKEKGSYCYKLLLTSLLKKNWVQEGIPP